MIEFEFLECEIPGFDSEFFVSAITDLIHSENKLPFSLSNKAKSNWVLDKKEQSFTKKLIRGI